MVAVAERERAVVKRTIVERTIVGSYSATAVDSADMVGVGSAWSNGTLFHLLLKLRHVVLSRQALEVSSTALPVPFIKGTVLFEPHVSFMDEIVLHSNGQLVDGQVVGHSTGRQEDFLFDRMHDDDETRKKNNSK